MKVLTLSIKRNFFDEILAGKKTHEYRDVRPSNAKRYYYILNNGKRYTPFLDADQIPDDDSPVQPVPVKYDAIKFLTGAYSGKRPWALVEVKETEILQCADRNGNPIVAPWSDGITNMALLMDYTLGNVLDKDLAPQ